ATLGDDVADGGAAAAPADALAPAVRDGTATARGGEVGVALNAAHLEPTATPMTVITRAMATKAGTANDRRRCTRGYCQSRSRGLCKGTPRPGGRTGRR